MDILLFMTPCHVVLAAFVLDLLIGDPVFIPHPIRWMGNVICRLEPVFRSLPVHLIISGALFAFSLIVGTGLAAWGLMTIAQFIHPAIHTALEIILLYFCLSASSLASASKQVFITLYTRGLSEARKQVSLIVGRETATLNEAGVMRAAVETTAENLVDGVISPLFFYAIGGIPLALAYKMVNTLDSMVGYRNEAYISFGKASARMDDVMNYIPARLSVPIIALASRILNGRGMAAMTTAFHEGSHHLSPNSGYPEAAFAGALAVKLNGPNTYHGRLVDKPYIGVQFPDIRPFHVEMACDLMILSSLLWVVSVAVIRLLIT
ncbi:MAG: adenosylcobinamide-phosphate synthase CbiB [Desulfatirhabdiaceae bacterium]